MSGVTNRLRWWMAVLIALPLGAGAARSDEGPAGWKVQADPPAAKVAYRPDVRVRAAFDRFEQVTLLHAGSPYLGVYGTDIVGQGGRWFVLNMATGALKPMAADATKAAAAE